MFNYFFEYCGKKEVESLIDMGEMILFVYVLGMFGNYCGNIVWVVLIEWYLINKNVVIVCDLLGDI